MLTTVHKGHSHPPASSLARVPASNAEPELRAPRLLSLHGMYAGLRLGSHPL